MTQPQPKATTTNQDRPLLAALQRTSGATATATAEMIAALAAVDAHDAWADTAYPSLYAYCRGELNWSEAVIKKRVSIARSVRRFPQLLKEIASGALHLSAVGVLQSILTRDNVDELICRARGESKRDVEALVATVAPRPAVPTTIRRLRKPVANDISPGLGLTTTHQPQQPSRGSASTPTGIYHGRRTPQRARTKPLSATMHKLTVTIDDDTRGLLEEVQALVSHRPASKRDVGTLLREALSLLRAEQRRLRRGDVKRPRTPKPTTDDDASKKAKGRSPGNLQSQPSRHIPAHIKRAVFERDGERCAYEDPMTGKRCVATYYLQIDHIRPFALGGLHSEDNCRVLCQHHNNQRVPLELRVRQTSVTQKQPSLLGVGG